MSPNLTGRDLVATPTPRGMSPRFADSATATAAGSMIIISLVWIAAWTIRYLQVTELLSECWGEQATNLLVISQALEEVGCYRLRPFDFLFAFVGFR